MHPLYQKMLLNILMKHNINLKIENVLSQRDHTYGVRDWTGVGDWFYYVVWFNKDLAINPAAIITDDGQQSTGGFLFKKGKNIPIKHINEVSFCITACPKPPML